MLTRRIPKDLDYLLDESLTEELYFKKLLDPIPGLDLIEIDAPGIERFATFSKWLRSELYLAHVTAYDFAKRCGISIPTMRKLLAGDILPWEKTLFKIFEKLGIPYSYQREVVWYLYLEGLCRNSDYYTYVIK